jgi:hypothetical protein
MIGVITNPRAGKNVENSVRIERLKRISEFLVEMGFSMRPKLVRRFQMPPESFAAWELISWS